jgi:hypothetical protein
MGFNHKKPEQIFVDTCFWCRPFDDQTTYRIQEETQALHRLLEFVDTGYIELIRSPFVHFELSFIDDYEKRVQIEKLIMDSGTFVTIPPHTQVFAWKIRHECTITVVIGVILEIAKIKKRSNNHSFPFYNKFYLFHSKKLIYFYFMTG